MTDTPPDDDRLAALADLRASAPTSTQADEVDLLAAVLSDPSTWVEPPSELEDAVVLAVADATPASIVSAPPAAARARRDPARRHLPVMRVAAAAAVVVIAIGTVVLLRGRAEPQYKTTLAATAVAPGASATVDIVRNAAGFRVVLDATGLPPLANGEYYQAWMKNPAGTLVPIGTFSSSDGQVTLWSGVSPVDYPTLTVTIEPADNDQASSGRRVLVGDIPTG